MWYPSAEIDFVWQNVLEGQCIGADKSELFTLFTFISLFRSPNLSQHWCLTPDINDYSKCNDRPAGNDGGTSVPIEEEEELHWSHGGEMYIITWWLDRLDGCLLMADCTVLVTWHVWCVVCNIFACAINFAQALKVLGNHAQLDQL